MYSRVCLLVVVFVFFDVCTPVLSVLLLLFCFCLILCISQFCFRLFVVVVFSFMCVPRCCFVGCVVLFVLNCMYSPFLLVFVVVVVFVFFSAYPFFRVIGFVVIVFVLFHESPVLGCVCLSLLLCLFSFVCIPFCFVGVLFRRCVLFHVFPAFARVFVVVFVSVFVFVGSVVLFLF